jgi:hypothetical protein
MTCSSVLVLLLVLALAATCAAFSIDHQSRLEELHLPSYPDIGLQSPPAAAPERSLLVQYPQEPVVDGSATFKVQDERHIDADAAYWARLQAEDATASSSHHSMHTMQASSESEWTMELMTAMAPYSHRIQPGFVYRQRPLTYTQVASNLTLTVKPGYLLLYEGGLTTNYMGVNYIEYDRSAALQLPSAVLLLPAYDSLYLPLTLTLFASLPLSSAGMTSGIATMTAERQTRT